jgi:ribose/xylose/arabinose/galactoside ABC-type transport system permease subunit
MAVSLVFIIGFFVNQDSMLDSLLYYTYALIGIAVLAALILPLINLLGNPKGLKKMLMSLILVVVFVGIAYLLSSGEPLQVKTNIEASESVLRMTDAGLILVYIMSAVAFVAILSGGLVRLVRNR